MLYAFERIAQQADRSVAECAQKTADLSGFVIVVNAPELATAARLYGATTRTAMPLFFRPPIVLGLGDPVGLESMTATRRQYLKTSYTCITCTIAGSTTF